MSLYIGEAAKVIGVSTATLKRWFRSAKVQDVARDRNGYRVFEAEDIERIRAYANQRFEPPPLPRQGRRAPAYASQA
ncbi:MerR family transcriptional regulator [bacterium]|nr:MerR family transcriptional regulator [bacterium]